MKLKATTGIMLTLLVVSVAFNVVPVLGSTQYIKIGVVGPKGWVTWDGLWEGANIARDLINNAGGINISGSFYSIELVDIDEHSVPAPDPATAIAELLTKLDAHPDMQFLIGGFRSECVFPMREAAMDYAEVHGRPIWFICGAATDELIDDGPVKDNPWDDVRENYARYKYMFRVSPVNATTLLNTLVAFLKDYVLPQKLAPIYGSPVKTYVVAENLVWCDGMVTSLQAGALGTQAEIVGVYRPSPLEMDHTPIFESIEAAEARLVVHIFSAVAGVAFIKQWGELEVPAVCIGINVESQMQEFYAAVGGNCEYEAFLASVGTRTPIIPGVTDKFWDDYVARYGHSPIYTAWGAYDAIMALAETLGNPALVPTWPMTCDQLIPIIEQTNRTGILGKFKYTEYHDVFCDELGFTWTQGYVRPLLVQWQKHPITGEARMEVVWPRDKPYSRKYMIPPWMYVLAETDFVIDGLVDIADISAVTAFWFNPPVWNYLEVDMQPQDHFIDVYDVARVAHDWGKNARKIYGQWPLP